VERGPSPGGGQYRAFRYHFFHAFDTLFATRDHLNFRQPLVTERFGVRGGPRRREFLGPFPAGAAVPIPLFPPDARRALHRLTSPSSSM
jgi:hypothetical protein